MTNPYEEVFEEDDKQKKIISDKSIDVSIDPLIDNRFKTDGKEPLDEILEKIQDFQKEAEVFSQLLTKTRAIDHKVSSTIAKLFLVDDTEKEIKSLRTERREHQLLQRKFESIIQPMKGLASIHLEIIKQFNQDINKDYYSIEKTDKDVEIEINFAIDNINMQRKVLAAASADLKILKDAILDTEKKIKSFINVGGINNISSAEFEIITQKNAILVSGRKHQFDYSFFDINLLDKTVLSLGLYMKETSAQYLNKLMNVFEVI